MRRVIEGWERDEEGDWFVHLSCLHTQHIRHRPPFRVAPWVDDEQERAARIGTRLDCPLCDRAQVPEGLEVARTTDTWTDATLPDGLRRRHRVAAGRWGLLHVTEGRLRFRAETEPQIDRILGPGHTQAIPPEVDHDVTPEGPVRLHIDFLRRARS